MNLMCPPRKRISPFLLLIIGASLMSAACKEVKFGGLTAREAFPDEKVGRLVEAAIDGDLGRVDELIEAGADVNGVGAQGTSPLLWVLAARNLQAAEHLLRAGADPNYKMDNGHSAMSLATGGDDPRILELLLKHGGDPNTKGPEGEPLLNIAALHQKEVQLRLLVEHGADLNYHSYGRTVGDVAAAMGRFDIVAYLLEHGLEYNLQWLARGIEIRQVPPDSEQQRWKEKVIELLKARGVTYPPPARK